MPFEGVLFATCVSAATATILMSLLTNYPFALAPGMGLNAYFTYTVCLGLNIPWQTALGAVFLSGVLFILLTVFKVWKYIVDSIPNSIKFSTGAGIGIFLAFIGLQNGGIVADSDLSLVTIGDLVKPQVGLTFFGLFLTGILLARRIKGSILIGILGTTLLAIIINQTKMPDSFIKVPDLESTFLKLDIVSAFKMGFLAMVVWIAFISLQLGILNLIPIPVLDGGQIFVLVLEGIFRRDFSSKVKQIAIQIGFAIFIVLIAFVILNDVQKRLPHGWESLIPW